MSNISNLIGGAVGCVVQVTALVNAGQTLSNADGDQLHALLQQTTRLRNSLIQYELRLGCTGKEVAKRYGLTQARVSQIKNMVL